MARAEKILPIGSARTEAQYTTGLVVLMGEGKENAMTTTIIVPGLDGSAAPHWQDWWARTDPNAIMVEFDDPHRPAPERDEAKLAGMILRHPGSILVGHSLGSVLIARMLARWPDLRIGAAMLVAPANPASSERLSRFDPLPESRFDIPAVVVASHDDP